MKKDEKDPPSAEEEMSRLIVRSGSGGSDPQELPPEERPSSWRFRHPRRPPPLLLLLACVGVLAAAALVSSSRRIRGEGQLQQQQQQQQKQLHLSPQPRGRWWRRGDVVEDLPSAPRNSTGANASQDEGVKREDEPASVDLMAEGACRDAFFFPSSSSSFSSSHSPTSFRSAWIKTLRKRVRDVALDYERQRGPRTVNLTAFTNWLDGVIFPFHTFERLQRSVAYPASNAPIQRLLEILQRRRVDPSQHPPVRVLVMGGSVVEGVTCTKNQVGLPILGRQKLDPTCPWPSRIGHILNQALFPMDDEPQGLPAASSSHPLFEVHNAATGGTNSQIGSMLLEYRLLPWVRTHVPDVIVLAYSANDAQDPDPNNTFQQHVPTLVRAAHNLRPCDVDLPLVIMVDDLYGHGGLVGATALGQTGSLYKAASWYGLMAVSYANVGRHQAVAAYYNATSVNPLHGSHLSIHLGMGYHISMALTLLFNVAAAMHNTCESIFWGGDDVPSLVDSGEEAQRIDALDEPLSKDRGRFHGSIEDVRRDWEANVRERERLCTTSTKAAAPPGESNLSDATDAPSVAPSVESPGQHKRSWSRHTTAVCEYAWLVSPASGVSSADSLIATMESVLSYNDGWGAHDTIPRHLGWEIINNRRGGSSSTSGSTIPRFELMLTNVTVPTEYLTVVSMRSYSEKWVGTRLKVSVQVKKRSGADGAAVAVDTAPTKAAGSARRVAAAADTAGSSDTDGTSSFEISGYHEIKTSVYFPNKFEIPGGGADVGDTVVISFELVEGQTFKIGGLALCRR